jgi:hypothetical protein
MCSTNFGKLNLVKIFNGVLAQVAPATTASKNIPFVKLNP